MSSCQALAASRRGVLTSDPGEVARDDVRDDARVWPAGTIEASTPLHFVCSVGSAGASSGTVVAVAMILGRRMTLLAKAVSEAVIGGRRSPAGEAGSSTNSTGSNSEVAAAVSATTAPPMPIDCRKAQRDDDQPRHRAGDGERAEDHGATGCGEVATVSAPAPSSSRKRETTIRL